MRVLITRPHGAAERTAERLRQAGHVPIIAPILRIAHGQEPMPDGAWDAIVLTSANALVAFPDPPRFIPVLAVGDRTAQAAEEAGFHDVRSASGDREALSLLAHDTLPPGQRLLIAAGRDRKDDLATLLRHAGHHPHVWTAYLAEAASSLPATAAAALREREVDCVMHYSRRSADVCVTLTRREGLHEQLRQLRHICISDDAAQPLHAQAETAPFHVSVAKRPDEDAMLDALDSRA